MIDTPYVPPRRGPTYRLPMRGSGQGGRRCSRERVMAVTWSLCKPQTTSSKLISSGIGFIDLGDLLECLCGLEVGRTEARLSDDTTSGRLHVLSCLTCFDPVYRIKIQKET